MESTGKGKKVKQKIKGRNPSGMRPFTILETAEVIRDIIDKIPMKGGPAALISQQEIMDRCGLERRMMDEMIASGCFPRPLNYKPRTHRSKRYFSEIQLLAFNVEMGRVQALEAIRNTG